jgi:predicted dehydrogenase
VAALELGKHVLCEARMSRDVAEARGMTAAASRHPLLVAQLVPAPFTLGVDDQVSRLLSDGAIGDLVSVEVTARGGYADARAPLTWRHATSTSGVNIMSLGIWSSSCAGWVPRRGCRRSCGPSCRGATTARAGRARSTSRITST